MKKVALALVLGLVCVGGAYADEVVSPVERSVNVAVQGTKNLVGLVFKGVHVVFHGVETIVDVGIGLTHSGLKVLEIPFTNGKPLVVES